MKRTFDDWINQFKPAISSFDYYIDLKKIIEKVDSYNKIYLNAFNSLIGSKNIEDDFEKLIKTLPAAIECIPILIAVREADIFIKEGNFEKVYKFREGQMSIDEYKYFLKNIGLFHLLQERLISNLWDYIHGVEIGLDTHARKNRGGHDMENLVESYIVKAGFVKGKDYFKELTSKKIQKLWNIDLAGIGKATKRFDFVIKTKDKVYAIETNFYKGDGSGSKLNETARSYQAIAEKSHNIKDFEFVWITDGTAWKKAHDSLQDVFNIHSNIYNITELENGILKDVIL